jgi:MEMO1 family protein
VAEPTHGEHMSRPSRAWFVVPLLAAPLASLAAGGTSPAPRGGRGEPGATPSASRIRPPAVAGTRYPEDRARLVSAAHFLMRLAASAPTPPGRPVALVVPHAGWSQSGLAAAAAFRLLRRGDFDRVVVVAPRHGATFHGYALDDATAYRTPLGDVALCPDARAALAGDLARVVERVADTEYSVEAELPFLQTALGRFCLVPVLVGETGAGEEKAFARQLARLDDARTLFVFSSDFTHYGPRFDFTPFGTLSPATLDWIRDLDRRAIGLLSTMDGVGFRSYLDETRATLCGGHALATMVELLPRLGGEVRPFLLAHYLSAELPSAQDDASVSYVALAFVRPPRAPTVDGNGAPLRTLPSLETVSAEAPATSEETGAGLVRLARAALRTDLLGTDDLDRELRSWPAGPAEERRQGVFVSLYRLDPGEIRARGRLRGRAGQAEPAFPLYYGTIEAALDAARTDAREPVTADELERLRVEVTVLKPPHPVASWLDVRLGVDGIGLEKGDEAALLLPQVPREKGWTLEETLDALAAQAGLPRDGWRDGARLSVFPTQVFEEP